MKPTLHIAWVAIRELIYEKVFYIALSFVAIILLVSILLGQMTYTAQTKLTLDFVLAGIQISMLLFSTFMGISLLQRELTMGSIAMILGKPISRASFLVGKFLGQIIIQLAVTTLMLGFTLLVCARSGGVTPLPICQAVLLISFETFVLTAATYFFSVNAGAITAAIASFFFFGLAHLSEGLSKGTKTSTTESAIWEAVKNLIPNFEAFNMKALASYGLSIPWSEVGLLALYSLIGVTLYLSLAVLSFQRKDILT